MKSIMCKTCLFEDVCDESWGCEHHSAATLDSPSNEEAARLTDADRDEYRAAWFQYTLEGFDI